LKALADFTSSVELSPDVRAFNFRALVYSELGECEKAIKDYDMAIELNPNFANAYYNRANAYAKLGDMKQCMEDYAKAADMEPFMALL
jgi:tetratricopeptide (TPR) repeat protein